MVDTLSKKIHVVAVSTSQANLRAKINEATTSDEFNLQIKKELLVDPIGRKYEDYRMEEDGLLLYKDRLYVPNNAKLRILVFDELHQTPYSAHLGYQKIVTTTRKYYL